MNGVVINLDAFRVSKIYLSHWLDAYGDSEYAYQRSKKLLEEALEILTAEERVEAFHLAEARWREMNGDMLS